MKISVLSSLLVAVFAASGAVAAQPGAALASFVGSEFEGGAKDLFGTAYEGEQVNTVYALPTGGHASMRGKFSLSSVPSGPLFVHLKARDDDAPQQCAIALRLNGRVLFEGANAFASGKFTQRKFAIPAGVLVAGENTLAIECREKEGKAGMPPWFQVAFCVIGPENFVIRPDLHKKFYVQLPAQKQEFPEPLPAGQQPGFKFRGTKGWAWTPKQYLEEIPWLARFKLNFLMNCYLSMFDLEHHANWADGQCNRWWEDLPAEKKQAYERVVRACQREGIQFCFGMNPHLVSQRIVAADSPESIQQLYKHYAWMQGLGVKWFNLSLDDATQAINATNHAKVVNTIFHQLRKQDPTAQMIFCPTYYWGDGTGKEQQPYLEILARDLDKDVYLFWTGDEVVGRITRKGAETFRRISGHRLFLWDNYPVNDDQQAMHLGPVIDRDPDLGEVVDGYMSNPHRKQNQINRLPLATCADYAYNPSAYEPIRSIGQAIWHVADTAAQRDVLRDLVEAYPGMLICTPPARGTGYNAVQDQFERLVAQPHSRQAALAYLEHLEGVARRMHEAFPNQFTAAQDTLEADLKLLKQKFKQHYP